jgi:hypothetical protein
MTMRVLHRVADLKEKVEPLTNAKIMGAAILREGNAIDEFHDEVRIAARSGAGIQNRRDVGMI